MQVIVTIATATTATIATQKVTTSTISSTTTVTATISTTTTTTTLKPTTTTTFYLCFNIKRAWASLEQVESFENFNSQGLVHKDDFILYFMTMM